MNRRNAIKTLTALAATPAVLSAQTAEPKTYRIICTVGDEDPYSGTPLDNVRTVIDMKVNTNSGIDLEYHRKKFLEIAEEGHAHMESVYYIVYAEDVSEVYEFRLDNCYCYDFYRGFKHVYSKRLKDCKIVRVNGKWLDGETVS